MKKPYFFAGVLCILLLLPFLCLQAQTPKKGWDKAYGGSAAELYAPLMRTSDGGMVIGSSSASPVSGDKSDPLIGFYDYWILKLDAQGNKLWDKTYGGTSRDLLTHIVETRDGGLLLGGSSQSDANGDKSQFSRGGDDYWIVKLDAQGNKLWDKTYGGSGTEQLGGLIETPDGGFLLAGTSSSPASGEKSTDSKGREDFWVVRISASGEKLWDQTYGGEVTDYLHAAIMTRDGNFLLGGSSNSPVSGDKTEPRRDTSGPTLTDFWVVKIDASGNKLWDKTLGGESSESVTAMLETAEGELVLGGYSWSNASGDKSQDSRGQDDYWLVKLTASGQKIWDRTYGGSQTDNLRSLLQTQDGGFLLAGNSHSPLSGDKTEPNRSDFYQANADYWIIKTDAEGQLEWDKTLGGDGPEQLYMALELAPDTYALSGVSNSGKSGDKTEATRGSWDLWLVMLTTDNATVDVVPPVLQGVPVDITVTAAAIPEPATVTAMDDRDGALPVTFSEERIEGNGWYTLQRSWSATDAAGNTATATQLIRVIPASGEGEAPTLVWDRTYGGSAAEITASLIKTSDGGMVLGGTSDSPASGDKSEGAVGDFDYWVLKLDKDGKLIWDKTYGSTGKESLTKIVETQDGGLLLAGTSRSEASGDRSDYSRGGPDYWIVKLDSEGNKLWDKAYGGSGIDRLEDVIETPDGGFLLAGYSNSSPSGDKTAALKGQDDYWVVRISAEGEKLWDQSYGGSLSDLLYAAIQTRDGGFLLAGSSYSQVSGDKSEDRRGSTSDAFTDGWVVKIDASGNKLWDKTLGGNFSENIVSAVETPEGELVLGGTASTTPADMPDEVWGLDDYWLVKLTSGGELLWEKFIGGSHLEQLREVLYTEGGGFLLAGTSLSPVSGDKTDAPRSNDASGRNDFWVVKTDASGAVIWDKTLGGTDYDQLHTAIEYAADSYVLAGVSDSDISGDKTGASRGSRDLWLVKLGSDEDAFDGISPTLIGVPDNITLYCDTIPEAPLVTATDNKDQTVEVIFIEDRLEDECPGCYTLVRSWSATDAAGNNTTLSQVITVIPPYIELLDLRAVKEGQPLGQAHQMVLSYTGTTPVDGVWYWGDGSQSAATIGEQSISGSHTYASTGMYSVRLELTDTCGDVTSYTHEPLVAYDPAAGFVTGGGWFATTGGKAHFSFNSRYPGADAMPEGNGQFRLQDGSLRFEATAQQWLFIEGHKAYLKGEGTLNGQTGYTFLFSAVDGDIMGQKKADRLRVMIWDANGQLVYDNQPGAALAAEASTVLGGGSIVIHTQGNKGKGKKDSRIAESDGVSAAGMAVYPNPMAAEGLWLSFPSLEQAGDVRATIYDSSGRLMAEKTFSVGKEGGRQQWQLEHSRWAGGLYLLMLEGAGISHQERIVK